MQEACIIAARDAYRGETVKAVVVLQRRRTGRSASRTSSPGRASTWRPTRCRASSQFVDVAAKSGSGKVMWRVLQERENEGPQAVDANEAQGPD